MTQYLISVRLIVILNYIKSLKGNLSVSIIISLLFDYALAKNLVQSGNFSFRRASYLFCPRASYKARGRKGHRATNSTS